MNSINNFSGLQPSIFSEPPDANLDNEIKPVSSEGMAQTADAFESEAGKSE